MKIEHISDNIIYVFTGSFDTKVDSLNRYYTFVDYLDNTFTITDRWTDEEFMKEGFNNEQEIYEKVEEIAKSKQNNQLQKKIIEFYKKKEPFFDDTLKHNLFDAWLYNTNIYAQVSEMVNISDNYPEYEKQTAAIFEECSKYYYERTTNIIVLLDTSEVILHKHFWINIDYDGSEIKKLILKYFGEEILEKLKNDHFYFNRKCFDNLLSFYNNSSKQIDNLLKFKRVIAAGWLKYINKHFLIPVSFANRYSYD